MSDLIDRQAALDAIEWTWAGKAAFKAIKNLPSAQPEREVYSNMSDKEFEKWLYEHGICHPDINEPISCKAVPLLIDSAINELPSAEPDRKTGRWMSHPNKEFKEWDVCTACGTGCKRREYEDGGMTEYSYSYCPHCGAKMEVEHD